MRLSANRCCSALNWLLVFAAAAAVLMVAERRVIRGKYTPGWDAERFFAPYYIHLADHARSGQFMLWDPWTNAGMPTCAYTEVGTFSPLTCLAAWATGPTLHGFVLYWLGFWLLSGLGMILLARHLGAPPWGALVVTLGFLMSGFFTAHAEHTSWLYSFAALPWIIWRLDVALLQRRTLPAVQAGALWGLSAMAGYPGVVLATAIAAGLWALGRTLFVAAPPAASQPLPASQSRPIKGLLRRLMGVVWLLAVWCAVGVVVMSPTCLTFFKETPGYSERSGALPRATVTNDNALAPRGLLAFGTPYVPVWSLYNGGLPGWSYTDPSSLNLYLGVCVTWLALAALVLRPGSAWRWWLVGMGLLGLGLAMGRELPLRGWLYDLFPPSRYFRHPSIFQCITTFVAYVLAALATADLAKAWQERRRGRTAALVAAAVVVAVAGMAAYRLASAGSLIRTAFDQELELPTWLAWLKVWLPAWLGQLREVKVHACLAWGALVLVVMLGLPAARWRLGRAIFLVALCTLAACDAVETGRLLQEMTSFQDPNITAAWRRMIDHHPTSLDLAATTGLDRQTMVETPPFQGVKHLVEKTPVLHAALSMTHQFHESWAETPALIAAATGPRRIWFAAQAIEAPPSAATFEAFRARAVALGAPPMVVHTREAMVQPPQEVSPGAAQPGTLIAQAPAATRIDVQLWRYTPNTLAFDVLCPADGWLAVTDRWAPGWQATVNGTPVPVYGGMCIFRALQVRAGPNAVCFTYRPWGHPWLALASYLTLGLVLVLSVVGAAGAAWRHRPTQAPGLNSSAPIPNP